MAVKPIILCVFFFFPAFSIAGELTLDPDSTECLNCHREIVSVRDLRICHAGVCDHPIGVDYGSLASRNRGLVSPASLDPSILLPGGYIGCTSCHIQYSASDHEAVSAAWDGSLPDPMLRMDNTGSRLCAACHLK